jgi:tetratricopeptide (TPR) repeat protein
MGVQRSDRALGLLAVFLLLRLVAMADTATAARALSQGRADDAAHLLQATLQAAPSDAAAHQLLCRVYYAEELPDAALAECERAAKLAPTNSGDQLWLGKAYGLKASIAGPLTGFSLAKRVRTSFERAVELDPGNAEAQTALGEFYIAAPSLIGGGLDKALRVATALEPVSPAAAHRLRALAAEKAKDPALAEAEFRQALAAHRSAGSWTDLADFYRRQGQMDKMEASLQAAFAADPGHGAAMMDVASILSEARRMPDLAEKALRAYLESSEKSEEAPVFKVRVMLGQLLANRGDTSGARQQYQAALQLASDYQPARKALGRVR